MYVPSELADATPDLDELMEKLNDYNMLERESVTVKLRVFPEGRWYTYTKDDLKERSPRNKYYEGQHTIPGNGEYFEAWNSAQDLINEVVEDYYHLGG